MEKATGNINEQIVIQARKFLGVTETKSNSEFTDSEYKVRLRLAGHKSGEAYCAYEAKATYMSAYRLENSFMYSHIEKLFSASAYRTFLNFKHIGNPVVARPEVGALVFWRSIKDGVLHAWKGHMGVVTEVYDGHLKSIEGNTSDIINNREGQGVFEKNHSFNEFGNKDGLQLIGFINPLPI